MNSCSSSGRKGADAKAAAVNKLQILVPLRSPLVQLTSWVGLFSAIYLCVLPESDICVDLDGSTGAAGQISSASLSLAPETYILSFDLIGSHRGVDTSTTVSLGSLYNQTFSLSSGDITSGIVNTTINVGTTTVAPLIFASMTPGDIGALLDNVTLVSTPEPATLSLLCIGLAGLMFGGRCTK
jgi:PEP-CTERM motif